MAKENLLKFMKRMQLMDPGCDVRSRLREMQIDHLLSEASDYNLPFTEKELNEVLEA